MDWYPKATNSLTHVYQSINELLCHRRVAGTIFTLRLTQLGSVLGRSGFALRKVPFTLSELDRSEIDLSPKRSECERSNAN